MEDFDPLRNPDDLWRQSSFDVKSRSKETNQVFIIDKPVMILDICQCISVVYPWANQSASMVC